MSDADRLSDGVEILDKVGAILDALAENGELSVADLVSRTEEPVSSTYRLLANLTAADLVDGGSRRGRYRLGRFFMRIGSEVEDRMDIRERAMPALRQLLAETGQTVYLCVRDLSRAVCLARLAGGDVRSMALRLGASLPLVVGGAPTSILAFLPESEYRSVRDAALDAPAGDHTTRTGAELDALVADIREQGCSISDGDVTPGVAAVGVPVFNHRGEIVAAISVSGIREHLLGPDVVDEVLRAARRCGETVSTAIGWSGTVVR